MKRRGSETLAPPPSGPVWLEREGGRLVWGLVALYVAVFFSVCVTKHRYYLYIDLDLALFTQAAHQILHGSLDSSVRGMNWLGDHSSLVMFLLAPLQALWPGPLSLLFVQTSSLALGGWAAWRLARHEGLAEPAPLMFATLYLLHPAIGYTNLFEFHPEALSASALLFVFLFLRMGRRLPMLLWAGFALLGKEDVALPVLMMGLYALSLRRARRGGDAAALAGLAVLSLAISFAWLKPAFTRGAVDYGEMYWHLGETPGQRVVNMLTHPREMLVEFFYSLKDPLSTSAKQAYYVHMLAPLLFLPLLSSLAMLIAVPVVAEHMFSIRLPQHTIVFQYAVLVAPILVAAAVLGVKRIARPPAAERAEGPRRKQPARSPVVAPSRSSRPLAAASAALAASVVCSFLFGPLWGAGAFLPVRPIESNAPDPIARVLRPHRDRMVARIPSTAGVVASFPFMPRLATRASLHSAHHVINGFYTFSTREFVIPSGVSAFVADMSDPSITPYQGPDSGDRLQELLGRNGLRPVDVAGDQVLFLAGARDTVELWTPNPPPPSASLARSIDGELELAGCDLPGDLVAPGGELLFRPHWRRSGVARRLYLMDVMLFDTSAVLRHRLTRPLGYGIYPTHRMPAGETVAEAVRLLIPGNLATGDYTLAFGLRWRDGRRREAPPAATLADSGVVRLGRVRVAGPPGVSAESPAGMRTSPIVGEAHTSSIRPATSSDCTHSTNSPG